MSFHDEKHVLTMVGTVIWEAVTTPDDVETDPGKKSFNLRIAVDPNAPEIAELNQLVQQALNENSVFKGVMPHGGNHPIGPIDAAKFPELPGCVAFTAATRLSQPPVFNATGATLNPMQFGPLLYNGTKVRLLVHAYSYNNKQKGVSFGLDGVQIIDGNPATAPRLAIGAAGMSVQQVASAFGGTGAAPAAAANPPATQQAQQSYSGYANTAASDAPPPPVDEDDAPPPPVEWPPQGWKPNPNNPAWWYNTTTKEQKKEADLRAMFGA